MPPPALKYNFRLSFGFFPSFALKFFSPSASKSTDEVSSSMNLTCKVPVSCNLSLEDIFNQAKGKYKLLIRRKRTQAEDKAQQKEEEESQNKDQERQGSGPALSSGKNGENHPQVLSNPRI
jgi:hypothetical protein